ncbi:MAG: hypothetical protein AW07_03142 [Candidatus Accumulibacter sp. SK-11]|nr:MAG: hypothetical protein AW07_03142 [Candidatus Accumulibacter sp. SK-11]HAY29350.1 hypothetical protein [Accumulibacter sp.]
MAFHSLSGISLDADMIWVDEFNWPTVIRTTEYALTGALIVDSGLRLAGRPITLQGDQSGGWITRATVDALRVKASELPGEFVLSLADGRSFNVIFAPEDPIKAEPIFPIRDPDAAFWYVATIKLIEV